MEEQHGYLYSNPEYYDRVCNVDYDKNSDFCLSIARQYLDRAPTSVLDVGCGTGRDLFYLSRSIPSCVGIDLSASMIDYAKRRYPGLNFHCADMSTFRLNQTFDLIISFGSAISYATTNEQLVDTLSNLRRHSAKDSLLVLEVRNAAAFIGNSEAVKPTEFEIKDPKFEVRARCTIEIDRRRQVLIRRRIWKRAGMPDAVDHAEYRLLFPCEITYFLSNAGFKVLKQFDNIELMDSELTRSNLYVIAMSV
jgi:SAM-dependent methyltransferase